MLTASMAKHSRSSSRTGTSTVIRTWWCRAAIANNAVTAGTDGVEIKSTRKPGGAVDTHGARDQWMCVFVYRRITSTEPAVDREPMKFTEVYLGEVKIADFRNNARGDSARGPRRSSAAGISKLRSNWIYLAEVTRASAIARFATLT